MMYEKKQDLKEIVDFIVVCMDVLEMVKQCNQWLKDKQDDGLKIGAYFVKDSKKYYIQWIVDTQHKDKQIIYSSYQHSMLIFNTIEKELETEIERVNNIGCNAGLVNANRVIHNIGGWRNSIHQTLDNETDTPELAHEFKSEYDGIDGAELIYIHLNYSSKQQSVMIHGF